VLTIAKCPTRKETGDTNSEYVEDIVQGTKDARYSFTLKRSLNPSGDDSSARKKASVLPTDSENGDARQGSKLHGPTLKKGGVCRHESRKGDAEPAILEVRKETSEQRVTKSKVKTT
jgi:hypothetical protein